MEREGGPEGGPRGVPVGEVEGEMKGRLRLPPPLAPLKDAARMVQRGDPLAERGRSGAIGEAGAVNIFLNASSDLCHVRGSHFHKEKCSQPRVQVINTCKACVDAVIGEARNATC